MRNAKEKRLVQSSLMAMPSSLRVSRLRALMFLIDQSPI
jgi:hypothetical protein